METSYMKLKFTPEKRKRKGEWIICETCKKDFYVFPCRLKLGMVKFCSIKCNDKIGRNNPFYGKKHSSESIIKMLSSPTRISFKKGKENYNHIRFGEYYIGKSFVWWRKELKRTIGKCEECGFSDKRILEVHHINKDRTNNIKNNLRLLCPNCHDLTHYKNKSGKYNHRS